MSSIASHTEQDVHAAVAALDDKWNAQASRLQTYLHRNRCLSQGLPWEDSSQHGATNENHRPSTAESLGKMLDRVRLDRTPTTGKGIGLDYMDEKPSEQHPMVFQFPEEDEL